jgi:hypothetical protein
MRLDLYHAQNYSEPLHSATADLKLYGNSGQVPFDKNFPFVEGSIEISVLYVKEILATKCGVRRR